MVVRLISATWNKCEILKDDISDDVSDTKTNIACLTSKHRRRSGFSRFLTFYNVLTKYFLKLRTFKNIFLKKIV